MLEVHEAYLKHRILINVPFFGDEGGVPVDIELDGLCFDRFSSFLRSLAN